MRDTPSQVIDATLKNGPPLVVTFYGNVLAMPIEKWVAVLTVIWIALQVVVLVRDKLVRNRRKTDYVRRRRAADYDEQEGGDHED